MLIKGSLASFGMRVLFISLFSCALACACADDRATGPDFLSYPQTPWRHSGDAQLFRVYLAWQTNAAEHVERIMATCEFGYSYPDLPGLGAHLSAYQYEITGRQAMRLCCNSPSMSHELSETQLAAVVAAIGELPHTNALPPIEHLLLVSFRQGTNWVTHSYDRRTPPKAMEKIFQVRRVLWERNFTVQ